MTPMTARLLAAAGVALVATLGLATDRRCPGPRALEDAKRVPGQPVASRHLGDSPGGDGRSPLRRQLRAQVLRAGRAGAGAGVLRCGGQGLDRVLLHHRRLSYRQAPVAGVLHRGAVRPRLRRVLRLDDLWRRQGAAERDLRQERSVLDRLQHDRPGDLGLVQRADRVARGSEGPEDALLRPRRAGRAEAWRVDPAARRRRHLSGAGARGDRRDRVLDAEHGHRPRLLSGREVQLLSRAGISSRRSASC